MSPAYLHYHAKGKLHSKKNYGAQLPVPLNSKPTLSSRGREVKGWLGLGGYHHWKGG